MKPECKIDEFSNKHWYLNGKLHREDGPAAEYVNGYKCWYLNGKLHREDGPAIECFNGAKAWYLNDKLHREDGPAIEHIDGYKEWYINGKRHREDGPAIEYPNGYKAWYINGKRHREDGPAIERTNGIKEWFIRGKRHREDGPAIECFNGDKEWYINGKRHREDGPAIEYINGHKAWYVHGKQISEVKKMREKKVFKYVCVDNKPIDKVIIELRDVLNCLKKENPLFEFWLEPEDEDFVIVGYRESSQETIIKPSLKIQKLNKNAHLPIYQKEGDSGMDLYVCIEQEYKMAAWERKIFPTGLRFEIPKGHEVQIRPRSGLACKHGITVINTPGTLDESYRGEVLIGLVNLSPVSKIINPNQRVAQAVLVPVIQAQIIEVDEISTNTDRAEGGFGHTGE